MDNRTIMQEIYKIFINDEILLRLLHYQSKNQRDKPLDKSKPDILTMPVAEKFKIIDNVVYFTDKKLELDTSIDFSRINFYLGNRVPKRTYSSGSRQLINNPYVSEQEIVFDIQVNMATNKVDFRLQWVMDRINFLLFNSNIKQLTKLKFADSYPINVTAKGFVGHKLIYYVSTMQSSGCGSW